MKKIIVAFIVLLISIETQAQTKNFIDQPYLEVNGNADTLVTPNEIYIRIVISEKDSRDKISVEEQEIKMVNTLKSLGIDTEKDLTTNDMISNFRFYILKSKDVLKSKQYILKLKDAVTTSKVFIDLEDLGIGNISIEKVDHSEMENIKNLMRSKAIENAKARATAVAKPLIQTVGAAIFIADNENFNVNNGLEGRVAGITVTGYGIANKLRQENLPAIEFEKIRITANINVKFILK